jgi:pyruvate carboxylase subunit A
MRRALYEYVLIGIKSNIPFHLAVMANRRFAKGELGTHFIDQETTLMEDIKAVTGQENRLQEKMSHFFDDKKRVAAIAVAAALAMSRRQSP